MSSPAGAWWFFPGLGLLAGLSLAVFHNLSSQTRETAAHRAALDERLRARLIQETALQDANAGLKHLETQMRLEAAKLEELSSRLAADKGRAEKLKAAEATALQVEEQRMLARLTEELSSKVIIRTAQEP
jgi:hypothetical protein